MNNYNIILINSIKNLHFFKKSVQISNFIALDTEFTRKSTYFSKLSILQICTSDAIYIVDSIENHNLLIETIKILYQSNVVKVFHGASNDLEIFYNLTNSLPTNIFDTQIAYMALSNLSNVSYAYLIENILNLKLDKSETVSNWNQRPLTHNQLKYASLDVEMLYKVYLPLIEQLKLKNRESFVTEKLQEIQNIDKYKFNLQKSVEQFAIKNNIESNYSLLAALIKWREYTAQQENIPKQYVITDSDIIKIILKPKIANKFLIKNTYLNKESWKQILDESKNQLQNFNSLQIQFIGSHYLLTLAYYLLDFVSLEENVSKDLICNKYALNIILHYYTDKNSVTTTLNKNIINMFFIPWKYNLFTHKLDLLLKGKLCLTVKNGKIIFI